MALEKMTIIGYSDNKFSNKNGDPFVVMINPENYSHNCAISYSESKPQGISAQDIKFDTIKLETISFDFILDDTGAVPKNKENQNKSVPQMIKSLQDVVYKYYGDIHQPNFIMLKWGSLAFKCRTESLKIDYQMFKPSGVPLRAKVSLSFKGYTDSVLKSLKANRSSPDLTHIITVKDGDTLPKLCNEVYNDCKYYLEVAKVNELVNIRQLEVGSKLIFPPLN